MYLKLSPWNLKTLVILLMSSGILFPLKNQKVMIYSNYLAIFFY